MAAFAIPGGDDHSAMLEPVRRAYIVCIRPALVCFFSPRRFFPGYDVQGEFIKAKNSEPFVSNYRHSISQEGKDFPALAIEDISRQVAAIFVRKRLRFLKCVYNRVIAALSD